MTCCASVAPRPPCSRGQPRQVHPAAARCRFQASRSACASCSRPGPPAPTSVAKRPARLSVSHSRMRRRNCSSSGLDRTRASPATGPAGPQGGLQARGSFVSGQRLTAVCGQRLTAARRLSLPSTCFVGGHLVELTVPAALAGAAGRFGDGPALAEPGGPRITYHQLLRQTGTVTRSLIAVGVAPGDRVAIWAPNTHHWVLGALGALSAGATL